MDRYLFRGIIKYPDDIFEGFWYGDLIHYANGYVYIRQRETGAELEVIPETVGQHTGASDKNGINIYEGDIVKYQIQLESDNPNEIGGEILECNHKVIFNLHGCGFEVSCIDYSTMNQGLYCNNHMAVIGNIHQSPELLKQENEI